MAEIRIAKQSDIAAIAKLEKELFSDAWSESMLADCLLQKHYQILVCEDETAGVVGYVISTHVADEAELLRIGVSPMMRRRGIGWSLMRGFAKVCDELETPNAFLEVRASNVAAIALYENSGFRVNGMRKNYYHHPDEDACLMAGEMHHPASGVCYDVLWKF